MKSELRQDLVSGDWIVISPGRAKRPEQLFKKPGKRKMTPKNSCPFEHPQENNGKKPSLVYPRTKREMVSGTQEKNDSRSGVGVYGNGNKWEIQVIENKYPAFTPRKACPAVLKSGPYQAVDAVGYHELVITRNHDVNFSGLSKESARQVFKIFQDRYLMLLNDKCLHYISIFHNWGSTAGASIYHPHYQIIAIPVIPPDVSHSLDGSLRYYKKYKKCVHCVMIDYEKKNKKRILYENAGAVVFTPYVSKEPFEVRIFPKKHLPYFENTFDIDLDYVVDALQATLKKIKKNLKDPDYNFFIHTAPVKDKENYGHYHWHIEVVPKMNISAGFELSTGVEINPVDPDDAVKVLRK